MLSEEIITVCSENRTKPINANCRVIYCWQKAGGACYSYRWTLKGYWQIVTTGI
jgi:hypothetical protein